MLSVFVDNPAASAACAFGALCLVIWPLFKARASILVVQIGIGLGFGLHYALLGAMTAALVNLLGSVQILVSLLSGTSRAGRVLGYSFIPAAIAISALTWGGYASAFAGIGTAIIAYGRMQTNEFRLRMVVLAGTIPWAIHDVLIMSPVAIVDALSLAVGAWSVARCIGRNTEKLQLATSHIVRTGSSGTHYIRTRE